MTKTTIVLFAAHHTSDNIAAQRFKSLVKYLDPEKYHIEIVSRTRDSLPQSPQPGPNIVVHELPGEVFGKGAPSAVVAIGIVSAFASYFPLVLHRLHLVRRETSWLVNAVATASRILKNRLQNGTRFIVMATYSPIDASLAARAVAKAFHINCIQDFRDGLVFESLGRPGRLAARIRQFVETRIVDSASLVTTVSEPIAEDFQSRYPAKPVQVLRNGFDPAEYTFLRTSDLSQRAREILATIPQNKQLLGHFGRISESDSSRMAALEFFVASLNRQAARTNGLHALFVGDLTSQEIALLDTLKCSKTVVRPVARVIALELMARSDALLLLTGKGRGCATGKLFEYLAVGVPVVCFSLVANEASSVLSRTRAGRTVLVGDALQADQYFADLLDGRLGRKERTTEINEFSKVNLADSLSRWIGQLTP